MTIRARALEWLRTQFGISGGAIYCSRQYTTESAIVGAPSWSHSVPLSRLSDRRVRYIRLLCERLDRGFHYLRVPKQYFLENRDRFVIAPRAIRLNLSALEPDLFRDSIGPGRVRFGEFLVDPAEGPAAFASAAAIGTSLRTRVYTVYVIELAHQAVSRNPSGLPPLYIGQTAHSPEHRFAQHREGGLTAASRPHRYGLRLRPDLYEHLSPFASRESAEAAEAMLADDLARQGYRVFWG